MATAKSPPALKEIGQGEFITTKLKGDKKAYFVTNGGKGFYRCNCCIWSFGHEGNKGQEKHIQTCPHLREIRGDKAEEFRLKHSQAVTDEMWEDVKDALHEYKLKYKEARLPATAKKAKRADDSKADEPSSKECKAASAKKSQAKHVDDSNADELSAKECKSSAKKTKKA